MSTKDAVDPAVDEDARAPQAAEEPAPETEVAEPDADDGEPVEVDYEGQTYRVPAALKGALMRHADYTRKTQDLAEQRRALEAGHAALAEAADAHGEHMADHARLIGIDDQIGRLEGLNWSALQQQDPGQAQQLMIQLFQLKQARDIAAAHLSHKQQVMAFGQRQAQAQQVEQAHQILSRQIEGWSPQLADQLAQFAMSHGLSEAELSQLSDPRLIGLLHQAYLGHQAQQQKSAADQLTQAQAIRPAVQVGGSGGGPTDPNRMSTDDWMRHRRGQLRTKAR